MAAGFFFLLFLFFAAFLYFFPPPKHLFSWLPLSNLNPIPAAEKSPPIDGEISRNGSDLKDSDLKSVFATFDKNGDGFITKQELIDSFKNIRIATREKEIEDMFEKFDSNGDGLIDFEEFCRLCEDKREEEEGDLKEAFEVFDRDKDGLISVEELGSVLCSLGLKEGAKVEDCKEMIGKVDKDGDGMVNFDEFKRMMVLNNVT